MEDLKFMKRASLVFCQRGKSWILFQKFPWLLRYLFNLFANCLLQGLLSYKSSRPSWALVSPAASDNIPLSVSTELTNLGGLIKKTLSRLLIPQEPAPRTACQFQFWKAPRQRICSVSPLTTTSFQWESERVNHLQQDLQLEVCEYF